MLMTANLKRVLVTHAKDAFVSQEHLRKNWMEFGYKFEPDFDAACRESDQFITSLEDEGVVVDLLPRSLCTGLDCLYTHDPAELMPNGFLICNMGKPERSAEPDSLEQWLVSKGYSISGRISGSGKLEGGDVVWLSESLVAIGVGYRTNLEGVSQFASIAPENTEVLPVHLPHWNGPGDVLHLMSMVSPLAGNEFLVYSRTMPTTFRMRMIEEGLILIEVPEEEYNTMGCNVLSLGNKTVLVEQKNTKTKRVLENHGYYVIPYSGTHISRAGEGGPTCLTRPLIRG